ncbi:MAG: DinB family protein [Chloroflexota bacterium]
MGQRAEALAAKIESAVNDLAAAIEAGDDAKWASVCAGEQWSVGVTTHHVAFGHLEGGAGFVRALAAGQGVPPVTMEMIDQGNAAAAEANANCGREETLASLRTNAAATVDFVRGLSDAQLDTTAPMAFAGGAELSTEQVINAVLISSLAEHVTSVRSA